MTERGRRLLQIGALSILLIVPALSAGSTVDLSVESVPVLLGDNSDDLFGFSLAVGDINSDGAPELFVGAPGRADAYGVPHAGAVYVIELLAVDALADTASVPDVAEWTLYGVESRAMFGASLLVSDLDGDGSDDLIIGAPSSGETAIVSGSVSIWFGGGSWDSAAPPDVTLRGTTAGSRLGTTLLAEDLDGDGAAELLVSAPEGIGSSGEVGPGVVYVLTGAKLRSSAGDAPISDLASAMIGGEASGDAVCGLQTADTNGDGVAEIIVGAYRWDGPEAGLVDAGRAYGVRAGALVDRPIVTLPDLETWSVSGLTGRGFLGKSLSSGDINADGRDDLIISAHGSKAQGNKLEASGETFVLFGESDESGVETGLARDLNAASVIRMGGRSRSDVFGLPVLLEDLNGDGYDDVIAASRRSDGPDGKRRDCGEVYAFWGSLRSVVAARASDVELANLTVVGAEENDSIGEALLVLKAVDGRAPALLVGAPDVSGVDDDGDVSPRRGAVVVIRGELLLR